LRRQTKFKLGHRHNVASFDSGGQNVVVWQSKAESASRHCPMAVADYARDPEVMTFELQIEERRWWKAQ
jgi:hypothetical protein